MNLKQILIVSLILTVLTIGAVSASDDLTSDDNLAVGGDDDSIAEIDDSDENDNIVASDDEDNVASGYYPEGAYKCSIYDRAISDEIYEVVSFESRGNSNVGNLSVFVNENKVFEEYVSSASYYQREYSKNLNIKDLNIKSVGDYTIKVTFTNEDDILYEYEAISHISKYSYACFIFDGSLGDPSGQIIYFESSDSGLTGNFSVYVNGSEAYSRLIKESDFEDDDGGGKYLSFVINLTDLNIKSVGDYTIKVVLTDKDNEEINLEEQTINVEKYSGYFCYINGGPLNDEDLSIVGFYLDDPTNVKGTLKVYVNGTEVYSDPIEESEDIDLGADDLNITSPGEYHIKVTVTDEDNETVLREDDIIISEYHFWLSGDGDEYGYGDDITFFIYLPNDATGNLTLKINGKEYEVNYADGEGNITFSSVEFNLGKYEAVATLTGDSKYSDGLANASVTIRPGIFLPYRMSVGEDESIIIRAPSGLSENACFKLYGGDDYTLISVISIPVVNGYGSYSLTNLPEGFYYVEIEYEGYQYENGIYVMETLPDYKITNNKNITMLYTAKSPYKVLITKDGIAVGAGEEVIFTFNGKTFKVKTDENGYATFNIPNVKPASAKYNITATYHSATVQNTVKVNSIIKASNKNVKKYKKVTKVKITLKKVNGKYLKGKILKIKFNKKTYKVKTNKKGVATWNVKKSMLKKLRVGKKYKYTVTYGKDTASKKLTIKR